jgi:VWFA-related protein
LRPMKSLRKTCWTVCAILLAALLTTLGAQAPQQGATPPPAPAQQEGSQATQNKEAKIITRVNEVVVPVTVKDSAGRLVPDLRADEFRILEDDVEQRITQFRADVIPLSIVLLIDNDLKSKDAKQVDESLRAIVAALSASDESFVCRFDQFFHEGKGFTTDQDKLLTELKRTRLDEETSVGPTSAAIGNGPSINGHSATGDSPNINGGLFNIKGQPTKALDDAVYSAAQLLKDRDPEHQRRKMILLVSDGVNSPKANVNKYDAVLKDLLSYNITVYGVGVGGAFYDRKFERLAKYAHDTGGDVYYGTKSKAMEELYPRVTEEARTQYTLRYSPAGTDRGSDYHSIEVRVRREGLTILAREGYYAGATPR